MKQKEFVEISVSPEQIWSFIEDPINLQLWNPKVRMVTAFHSTRNLGYAFGIMYEMSKKATEYRGEITTFDPPFHLVFTFSEGGLPSANSIKEEFVITRQKNGSLLERTIHFGNTALPLWAKILMWIIFRFGSPVGKPYLDTLREIIEERNIGKKKS